MKVVYKSLNMEELETYFKRHPMLWLSIATTLEIFVGHINDNMVVVNVNSKAEFTYLGMV